MMSFTRVIVDYSYVKIVFFLLAIVLLMALEFRTKLNLYVTGELRDLHSNTQPGRLSNHSKLNWYLNPTGKKNFISLRYTNFIVKLIEKKSRHNIHPCTNLRKCLSNCQIGTLETHIIKHVVGLFPILNAITLFFSDGNNLNSAKNWKRKFFCQTVILFLPDVSFPNLLFIIGTKSFCSIFSLVGINGYFLYELSVESFRNYVILADIIILAKFLLIAIKLRTKLNPYNPGDPCELRSPISRPERLSKYSGLNWYLNPTGKIIYKYTKYTYILVKRIEKKSSYNMHTSTIWLKFYFLSNCLKSTVRTHVIKCVINIFIIRNGVRLFLSSNNIHPSTDWKRILLFFFCQTFTFSLLEACFSHYLFTVGIKSFFLFLYVILTDILYGIQTDIIVTETKKKVWMPLLNNHNLILRFQIKQIKNNYYLLNLIGYNYDTGDTVSLAILLCKQSASQNPGFCTATFRQLLLPGLIFKILEGKQLRISLKHFSLEERPNLVKLFYLPSLLKNTFVFGTCKRNNKWLLHAFLPRINLVSVMFLHDLKQYVHKKKITYLLNHASAQHKCLILQQRQTNSRFFLFQSYKSKCTLFWLSSLWNIKINSTVDCFRLSTKKPIYVEALKLNLKKRKNVKISNTCFSVFLLWPFSAHFSAVKIYKIFNKKKLSKLVNNNVTGYFCLNTNFYLITGANMSSGFDVDGINRAMAILRRRQDQLTSTDSLHRLPNNIGLNNPSLINNEPAPLIDLSDTPTIHPDENSTTNTAAPAQETMIIDTSVQFFSNTAPAILAELRRQKLEESTFLTEQTVCYAPLRAEYDRYINQFLLTSKLTRTSILLHRPNGEPAERFIKPGERLGDGWFAEKLSIGCGKKKVDLTITMPPKKPLLIIIGASHASRMASLAIMSDPHNLKTQIGQYLWQRTAFVRTVATAAELLPIIKEILAKICRLLIEVHGNFVDLGTNIVLIPMSWDSINMKISMDKFAQNLLEMAHTVFSFITKTAWQQRWALSFSFTELPLLHKHQVHLYRLNHVIRFVNELLSTNHPPIRPWLSLTELKPKNVETLKSVEVGILQNRYLPYENRDGTHLSATGYSIWLQTIINGSIMAIVDQSTHPIEDDFEQVDTIHIDCNHEAYFQTTATLKRAIENDLLNVTLIAKLRQLERPRIDCSRLIMEYPDIREVEEVIPDEDRSVVDQPRRHRHAVNGGGPTFNYQHRPRHDDHRGTRGRRPNRGMYNHVYYPY